MKVEIYEGTIKYRNKDLYVFCTIHIVKSYKGEIKNSVNLKLYYRNNYNSVGYSDYHYSDVCEKFIITKLEKLNHIELEWPDELAYWNYRYPFSLYFAANYYGGNIDKKIERIIINLIRQSKLKRLQAKIKEAV